MKKFSFVININGGYSDKLIACNGNLDSFIGLPFVSVFIKDCNVVGSKGLAVYDRFIKYG